jgi:choline kinase
VRTYDGRVENIGKDLKDYNGLDTGLFLCTPAVFRGIEQSISEYGVIELDVFQ